MKKNKKKSNRKKQFDFFKKAIAPLMALIEIINSIFELINNINNMF